MMISDEEKRWLVVGIAVNKVAAPVLRDFIKQGMVTHFTNLDTYCSGLTTPCTLKTLTYHEVNADPNLRRMKFENINNNLHVYGKSTRLYNYSVTNSVDLAKLYLPDYLTGFEAFDESLDMSAILRLLGFSHPAPIFSSPNPLISIQSSADDVRENVRNKWGHCNITDWTEALFNDCFTKLKMLVSSLGLTCNIETTTVDQLSDWQTKGCQLCMGHAVDQTLLALVQQDVKELIKNHAEVKTMLDLQSKQLSQAQETVAVIQEQQSSGKARLDEHASRLHAMEEKVNEVENTNKEEIKIIIERLVSIEKELGEELLRRVQDVEEALAVTDHIVGQLDQNLAKTDDKVFQLEQEIRSLNRNEIKPGASPVELFDVRNCQRKLAEHYQKTAKVPTTVWSSTYQVHLNQIYTRLSWVEEEQSPSGSSQKELNHYTQLLTEETQNGSPPKRVLVQGQTGIGKTTFVKKVLLDWSNLDEAKMEEDQKDALRKFELVVAVNLKEVSKCQTLGEIISHSRLFPKDEISSTDDLLSYMRKNQEKVLLVFDGYDEYRIGSEAEEKYGCRSDSPIVEIFQGNTLRDSTVLITTRSSRAGELRGCADRQAEVTGFNISDRKAFMAKFLENETQVDGLLEFLVKNKMEDLARIPLLSLFFCLLWKDVKEKLSVELKGKAKLYGAIMKHILQHSRRKHSPKQTRNVNEENYEEILAEIGKVALAGLLKGDLVFEYGELSDKVRGEKSLIVGLLQLSEYGPSLEPMEMVSFIHKSIQEYLAAWYVTYKCIPEGNLGGIEEHARTLDDCLLLENVYQFVCGLSDEGAVKVFQHLKSVRINDPNLDFAGAMPDVEYRETDYPQIDITSRQRKFIDLVFDSFREVGSKAVLVRQCFDCTCGIFISTRDRPLSEFLPKATDLTLKLHSAIFIFQAESPLWDHHDQTSKPLLEFLGCVHVSVKITDDCSIVFKLEEYLRRFRDIECGHCTFRFVLSLYNGQFQFYITDLELKCRDHTELFTKPPTATSGRSTSAQLRSGNSCLKLLKFLTVNQSFLDYRKMKELGTIIRHCKFLKRIEVYNSNDAVCKLLEQVLDHNRKCRKISAVNCSFTMYGSLSNGAVKLAALLPNFNVIRLHLDLRDCSAAAVNALVASITHKTLEALVLSGLSLTPAAAAALGRSLPEMSSLEILKLTGADGSILQAEEMEALFGRFKKTLPLRWLSFSGFNVRGCLAALTNSFRFFPNLRQLQLVGLNMSEGDFRGLLESFRFIPKMRILTLVNNPVGHAVTSVVPYIDQLPELYALSVPICSSEDMSYVREALKQARPRLLVGP